MKISVFLVEDETGILQTLECVLPLKFGCEVVGAARSAEEALKAIPKVKPVVIWVDLRLGVMDGAALIRTLKLRDNEVKSVICTGTVSAQQIKEAMTCEPNAFCHKDDELATWRQALQCAASGGVFVSSKIQALRKTGHDTTLDKLTPCERSVFHLLINGASIEQVGEKLGIAASTVRHHKEKIFPKLGVHSMDALVRVAGRLGFVG